MRSSGRACVILILIAGLAAWAGTALAKASRCEECHRKLTPGQVADFNRGKMAAELTCEACHGAAHNSAKDVDKAQFPSISTCKRCHEAQAGQYLSGKHALGGLAVAAMPRTHMQPPAYIEGRRGCGGCHTQGITDQDARMGKKRFDYPYGFDCQNCHTRHAFSAAEARQPEACLPCHQGFDHPQWEMWSTSKHGVAFLADRAANLGRPGRAPTCQTCHMPDGDHRVFSAWGFLAVRLPEADQQWLNYRTSLLKGLGVLDKDGKPTARLEAVKAAKVARLTAEDFAAERARFTAVCRQCHAGRFVKANMAASDQMVREADALMAEAIEIVAELRGDGTLYRQKGEPVYPDLLAFYDVYSNLELTLYEMFMDHRMKTFQAGFHQNPEYATWYGYAKMVKDLSIIREDAARLRETRRLDERLPEEKP